MLMSRREEAEGMQCWKRQKFGKELVSITFLTHPSHRIRRQTQAMNQFVDR